MAAQEVLEKVQFNGFPDWAVKVNPIGQLWTAQPTYLIVQAVFCLGGIFTLIHALCCRGRYPYLWLGTILYGLFIECICYTLPDADNFWHSQTPVMFFGLRLPLHIILLYPCFLYQASVAVSNLRLPAWAEPFAVGLIVVLIDIPYDIVSVKFVHWTWHDTDPNIADRHYWVPWNSYFFHCAFSTCFTFWFHSSRRWMTKRKPFNKWEKSSFRVEAASMVIASIFGPLLGVGIFMIIYHPLHDLYKIHSEVTFFIFLTLALLVVWSADRKPKPFLSIPGARIRWILLLHLFVHYSIFLGMVAVGKPEKELSTGLHEPIGPCGVTVPIKTPLGMVLKRNAFLCVNDYNEDYFNFSCTKQKIPSKAQWYTICGTPFANRVEYITVISALTVLAAGVFWNLHFKVYNSETPSKKPSGKKVQ